MFIFLKFIYIIFRVNSYLSNSSSKFILWYFYFIFNFWKQTQSTVSLVSIVEEMDRMKTVESNHRAFLEAFANVRNNDLFAYKLQCSWLINGLLYLVLRFTMCSNYVPIYIWKPFRMNLILFPVLFKHAHCCCMTMSLTEKIHSKGTILHAVCTMAWLIMSRIIVIRSENIIKLCVLI